MRPAPKHLPAEVKVRQGEMAEIRGRYRFLTYVMGGGVEVRDHRKPRDPVTAIRGASLRGQLRFWWRAMNPRGCASLSELHQTEGRIWGSTEIPSPVILDIVSQPPQPKEVAVFSYNDRGRLEASPGMREIAYGAFPLQPDREHQRGRGAAGVLFDYGNGDFEISIRFPEAMREDVETALRAWSLLGGLGGRTRRGFGAITPAGSPARAESAARELLEQRAARPTVEGVPSPRRDGLHLARRGHSSALDAWKEALGVMQRVRQGRGHGRNDPAEGSRSPAGRSRWPEPDEIRRLTRMAAPRHATPVVSVQRFPRAQFGLPIVFHFHPGGHDAPDAQGDPNQSPLSLRPKGGGERFASPVLLRPVGADGGFKAAALLLDTRLPDMVLEAGRNTYPASAELTPSLAAGILALKGASGPIERFLMELTR